MIRDTKEAIDTIQLLPFVNGTRRWLIVRERLVVFTSPKGFLQKSCSNLYLIQLSKCDLAILVAMSERRSLFSGFLFSPSRQGEACCCCYLGWNDSYYAAVKYSAYLLNHMFVLVIHHPFSAPGLVTMPCYMSLCPLRGAQWYAEYIVSL